MPKPPVQNLDSDAVLLETEKAFAEFQRAASPDEIDGMKELVRVWSSLARARTLLVDKKHPPAAREALRAVRELKVKFLRTRALVRDRDSFRSLSPGSRSRLAGLLFEAPRTAGVVPGVVLRSLINRTSRQCSTGDDTRLSA